MSDAPVLNLTAASQVLHEIGERFNELKRERSADAYRFLQEALMSKIDVLVPVVIPLKDFLSMTTELEKFLKGSVSQQGETPTEFLARWLNEPESPVEESAAEVEVVQ